MGQKHMLLPYIFKEASKPVYIHCVKKPSIVLPTRPAVIITRVIYKPIINVNRIESIEDKVNMKILKNAKW